MKKFRLTLYIVVLLAILIAGGVVGCTQSTSKDAATSIQVEETHVYLAPEGDPSTYIFKPSVFPLETASQEVYYRLLDSKDREFVNISSDGVLQAKKLKTDEEGNNVDITLRVVSAVTPSVYVDVTVTIEIVAVQRIVFNPEKVVVELQSDGVQLKPIFYPSHAITGRNVDYQSDDISIASVDGNGFVTPKKVGQVSIWVKTPVQSAFDNPITGKVTIDVRYSSLNYRMDLTSDKSTLNQIVGSAETISFVLSQLDSSCDPSPTITWYVNTTTINEIGVKDSKILNYTPSTLPAGEYYIRAELRNGTQKAELKSEVLRMYNPLDAISTDVTNGNEDEDGNKSFEVGDIARLLVTYGANKYPPESYRWTINKPDGTVETLDKERTQNGNASNGDLSYALDQSGEYTFTAEAVVKGKLSGVKSTPVTVTVTASAGINTLYNLHVDGVKTDEGYAPILGWDALPYESEFSAEIRLADGNTYAFSSEKDSDAFGYDYFIVPSEVADFTVDFEVRVRDGENRWTEWVSYTANTVTSDKFGYFDTLVGDFNAYIADMEELGKLLDYITVFRPESLLQSGETDIYEFTLYIPFAYDDLPEDVYHLSANDVPSSDNTPSYVNAYKLVVSAMRTYVESTAFRLGLPSTSIRGANTIQIEIKMNKEPQSATSYAEGDEKYVYEDVDFAWDKGSGEERTLAIDGIGRNMTVETSNQLYLAVQYGYKPVPVEGSAAERIYKKARAALYASTDGNDTVVDKARDIYRWIAQNVRYDYKIAATEAENLYLYDSFYLEGVFDDGVAVCDGMAKAYALLLRMEGILAYKVCGQTLDGGGHAWNKFLTADGWVGSDVTWGNAKMTVDENGSAKRIELVAFEYFMMTDADLDETGRLTYGAYPSTAKVVSSAFGEDIGSGYDMITDSDEELIYQVGTYLKSHMGESGEVWMEITVSDEYVASKSDDVSDALAQINTVIGNSAGDGYKATAYSSENRIYVRLVRS